MKKQVLASVAVTVLLVSACESMEQRPGETMGTVLGAVGGAVLGSKVGDGSGQMIATAIGGLAGAWLGSELGRQLDERDMEQAEQTAQDSLENNPSGVSSTWSNPDSGNSGSVTPTNTYQTAEGEDCREFESTVNADGKTETTVGQACRQPDGSWMIVQ